MSIGALGQDYNFPGSDPSPTQYGDGGGSGGTSSDYWANFWQNFEAGLPFVGPYTQGADYPGGVFSDPNIAQQQYQQFQQSGQYGSQSGTLSTILLIGAGLFVLFAVTR